MKLIRRICAALCVTVTCAYASAQCCSEANCQNECEGPRPTCGAPYPVPEETEYGRPADPKSDPFRNLNVSEEQKAKVHKAVQKRNAKAEKRRKKMEKERAKASADFDKEIRKILTPAQYAQFKQNIGSAVVRRYKGRKPVNGNVGEIKPGPAPRLMTGEKE